MYCKLHEYEAQSSGSCFTASTDDQARLAIQKLVAFRGSGRVVDEMLYEIELLGLQLCGVSLEMEENGWVKDIQPGARSYSRRSILSRLSKVQQST
jgi:hypothetical protein